MLATTALPVESERSSGIDGEGLLETDQLLEGIADRSHRIRRVQVLLHIQVEGHSGLNELPGNLQDVGGARIGRHLVEEVLQPEESSLQPAQLAVIAQLLEERELGQLLNDRDRDRHVVTGRHTRRDVVLGICRWPLTTTKTTTGTAKSGPG